MKVNGKWGIINTAGDWIVSPNYDTILLYEDYIKATIESNSLYLNFSGEQIIEPIVRDEKPEYSDGLVKTELNSKYGFKDEYGNWIIRPQYEEAFDYNHGWTLVSSNGIRKYIDKSGRSYSIEGMTKAYSVREVSYRSFGFIDDSDRWIIGPLYEDVGYFYEGLAKAKMCGKWGFIDKSGKWVVEPKYEDVGNFHNGRVSVILNDECHWINSIGDLVR